jgi:hypothetical protein
MLGIMLRTDDRQAAALALSLSYHNELSAQ